MMGRDFRGILSVLFVTALLLVGRWLTALGSTADNHLLEDAGRGLFTGPFLLLGTLVILHIFSTRERDDLRFRVVHITAMASLVYPIGIIWANWHHLTPANIAEAILGFSSSWLTYWGCRLIIDGGYKRRPHHRSPFYE